MNILFKSLSLKIHQNTSEVFTKTNLKTYLYSIIKKTKVRLSSQLFDRQSSIQKYKLWRKFYSKVFTPDYHQSNSRYRPLVENRAISSM